MKFDIHYINLSHSVQRRASIEQSFREAHFSSDVSLHRFEAVVPDQARIQAWVQFVDRFFSIGNLGCFLSHTELLRWRLEHPSESYFVISEDDTIFSPHTEKFLQHAVQQLIKQEWDMLYTDVALPLLNQQQELLALKEQLPAGSYQLLNLAAWQYFGTSFYVVNPASLVKLYELLANHDPICVLLDSFILRNVQSGYLKCFTTLPFITSLSQEADQTTIQLHEDTVRNNAFRRQAWIGA